jgi:hypothetical protein
MDQLVTIYVPTYRNEYVFSFALNSYLEQTHKNICVKIFDNSFCEGDSEINNIVKSKNDSRIIYHKNLTNIGATNNYLQIFRSIRPGERVIIMASDMALQPNAVESMLRIAQKTSASIVMPRSKNFTIESKIDNNYKNNSIVVKSLFNENIELSGIEIIKNYFSDENINGEFFSFSFAGSLIDGGLLYSISRSRIGYRFHGMEQYISMELALNANKIFLLNQFHLINFLGHPRLGGTERPNNYLTRLEPILACEQLLNENKCVLLSLKFDFLSARKSQIRKIIYYYKNYSGFFENLIGILIRNILIVISMSIFSSKEK